MLLGVCMDIVSFIRWEFGGSFPSPDWPISNPTVNQYFTVLNFRKASGIALAIVGLESKYNYAH